MWLRYNMFFVLYPLGIMSEVVMMWKACEVARKEVQYALLAIMVAYIPGMYLLENCRSGETLTDLGQDHISCIRI